MKPRILITTASRPRLEGLRRFDAIGGLNYAEAVLQTGGTPSYAPNVAPEFADDYLANADGLLLSGGADVDPCHFGQTPHRDLGVVDETRDLFELALYEAAKRRQLPVLGICRGIQVIAIAEGGTLHQHLPAVPDTQQHGQRNIDGTLFHRVKLEPASQLARAFGNTEVRTNSYHHQAVDEVGPSLKVTGWADDGVVEALEGKGESFVLGVQWHPEMSFARYPEQLAPFTAFMDSVRLDMAQRHPVAVAV